MGLPAGFNRTQCDAPADAGAALPIPSASCAEHNFAGVALAGLPGFNFDPAKAARADRARASRGDSSLEFPFASARASAQAGALGTLTVAAFLAVLIDKLQAASSEPFLQTDPITFNDLQHGTLLISPRGGNGQTIVLDDPEMTIIVGPPEAGSPVQQVSNSSAEMIALLSFSEAVNTIYQLGLADPMTTGSIGTPTQRAETQFFMPDGPPLITLASSGGLPPLPPDPPDTDDGPAGGQTGSGEQFTLAFVIDPNRDVSHDEEFGLSVGGTSDDTDDPLPIQLAGIFGFDPDAIPIGRARDGTVVDPFVNTTGSVVGTGRIIITVEASFGAPSGLSVTGGGPIFLFTETTGGHQVVVGREGVGNTADPGGAIAFIIYVTENGQTLWVQQSLPIHHPGDSPLPIDDTALRVRATLIATSTVLTKTQSVGHQVVFEDDVPVANDDANSVTEGLDRITSITSGNLFGPTGASVGDDADTIGSDGAAVGGPVTGARVGTEAGGGSFTAIAAGGTTIAGTWGDLTLYRDGTYTYALKTALIPTDVTSETFTYQIEDGDGDTDLAELVIALHQDTRIPDTAGSTATVYEDGLADGLQYGAASETTTGSFTVNANGENYTLTLTGDLGGPVTITAVDDTVTTSKGVLTITSISEPVSGVVTYCYSYTLSAALSHSGQGEGNPLSDTISMAVIDATGDSDDTPASIVISIIDDVPAANPVTESLFEPVKPGTIPPAHGSLVPPGAFGADGGYVESVTIDEVLYTYDPANGGSISSTVTHDFNPTTKTLTVALVSGASFAINMDTGHYTYTPPAVVNADLTELIDFVLADNDGDTASSTLTIDVIDSDVPPVVRDDRVITNISAQLGLDKIVIPEFALLYNDTDANGQTISITDVANGESGTVSRTLSGSVTFTENNNSSTNGGTFAYTGSTESPTGSAAATVTIDRSQINDSTLDGTELGDILIGQDNWLGIEYIRGGGGNDVLIGNGAGILGGDILDGGAGDDLIVYSDGVIFVDGGSNTNNDLLDAGNRGDILSVQGNVDFTRFFSGIIEGIETISMLERDGSAGDSTITLSILNVLGMADQGRANPTGDAYSNQQALRIDGTDGDVVNLRNGGGRWLLANDMPDTPDGYTAYSFVTSGTVASEHEQAYLFVATGVTVNVV